MTDAAAPLIRIAIAGASGTGKTTLAMAIAERYGLPINPVGSRSVAASMGLSSPYEVDSSTVNRRVEFQKRLFESKRGWEEIHSRFVTDRSTFDNLAYCLVHMPGEVTESMMNEHRLAMDQYHVVFVLRMRDYQDLDDPARSKNIPYHWAYEKLLDGLFSHSWDSIDKRPVKNHLALSGTKGARFELAFAHIDHLLARTTPGRRRKTALLLLGASSLLLGTRSVGPLAVMQALAHESHLACEVMGYPRTSPTKEVLSVDTQMRFASWNLEMFSEPQNEGCKIELFDDHDIDSLERLAQSVYGLVTSLPLKAP